MTNKGKSTRAAGTVTVELVAGHQEATAKLSGADPDEAVLFHVDSGQGVQQIQAQADSNGKAEVTFVPPGHGTYRVSVTSLPHTDSIADPVEVEF